MLIVRFIFHPLFFPTVVATVLGTSFHFSPRLEKNAHEESVNTPYSFCFAPGTAKEVMERYSTPQITPEPVANSLLSEIAQQAFQVDDRWFTTATNGSSQSNQGDPLTLTWSIADDGGTFITADGSIDDEVSSNSDLRSRLAAIYGGSTTDPAETQSWFPLFQSVFDNLSANSGINFVYEPADDGASLSNTNRGVLGIRGDIRISGHALDGNSNVLAYNFFPDFGDMVIDTNDNFFTNTSSNSIRLRNVLEHEIGHGLGLSHVCPIDSTKLMEPFINTNFTGAQFDDIYSLQRNYGDPFEKHNNSLSNDSFANAAPLPITFGTPTTLSWLSIDDNSDTDYYSIPVQAGQSITATVTPSPNTYLEGSQNFDGSCSTGTNFDSSQLHDLSLELFDPNQTLLASATNNAIGSKETITPIIATMTGSYVLRVTGGNANNAQLYTLEAEVNTPSVIFELISNTQTAELFSEQNGAPDPMESLEYTFTIRNSGIVSALNATAVLSGPTSFIPLQNSANLGDLKIDQSITVPLTFALDANCGETVALSLFISEDNGVNSTFNFEVTLGADEMIFSESFDDSTILPTGWQSQSISSGTGWSANSIADTPPNSFFAADVSSPGESILTTPLIGSVTADATLSFRHFYATEANFDGGVLEISIAGGAWQDILAAGGSFNSGAYVSALQFFDGTNPLNSRQAWHGNSGGFITTEVALPISAANQAIQFRWRMGHDSSVSAIGWRIDTITIEARTCDDSGAMLTMSSNDIVASEFTLSDNAELRFETPVAILDPLPINLTIAGSATPLIDYSGLDDLILPANSNFLVATIDALEDDLAEGPETLIVTSPDGGTSINFTLLDSPYGNWAASTLNSSLQKDPTDNPDGDSLSNFEEYIFATNPLQPSLAPGLETTFVDNALRLASPITHPPADLLITPKSSPNLIDWTSSQFVRLEANKYVLEAPTSPYFMRLEYSLLENDAPLTPSGN